MFQPGVPTEVIFEDNNVNFTLETGYEVSVVKMEYLVVSRSIQCHRKWAGNFCPLFLQDAKQAILN